MVSASPARVLYVDDEPTRVSLITRTLEKRGIAAELVSGRLPDLRP